MKCLNGPCSKMYGGPYDNDIYSSNVTFVNDSPYESDIYGKDFYPYKNGICVYDYDEC